jgi:hypothetical protein
VSLQAENAPLAEVLERCFQGQPLTCQIIENTIVVSVIPYALPLALTKRHKKTSTKTDFDFYNAKTWLSINTLDSVQGLDFVRSHIAEWEKA